MILSSFERQQRLIQFLSREKRASIAQICQLLSVSEATARRDLEALAKQGQVRRVHGGAIAVTSAPPEPPLTNRAKEQAEEKRRIGAKAAELITDGDTVFLGSGTTVAQVAQFLHGRQRLTVITNSLLVMETLEHDENLTLIGLGGLYRSREMSFIGHLTEQALSELRVDKVFMGVRAIDITHGLTNDYLPETQTDRAILRIGQQIVLLADHTKCARFSTVFLAPATAIHLLVTDQEAPQEFIAALATHGVQIIAV